MNGIVRLEPRAVTAADFAARITTTYRRSVEAIIETGRLIAEAKLALDHGEFLSMVANDLPFGASTAARLMKVAADERLSNPAHVQHLPASWGTLYEISKLSPAQFDARIADGTISPRMERRDIAMVFKRERRQEKEVRLAERLCALPDKKYGIILTDPEWKFKVWSDAGLDRSADNHYPTSVAEEIAARDVPSIAADNCVLYLWATVPMLVQALAVMGAWGFHYRSHHVWVKDRIATGYWTRNQHDILLIGARGNVPAPAMGDQFSSVIHAARGEHSEKPSVVYEMIERMFPHLPKIELNARGHARAGWDVWGNEAEGSEAA